ncbi:hypothetical protein PVAP13_4KG143705 [Panicum virgatum]|uniref:Uncharacterized protein n=1 Tax=Panicum virgatum TaxID=38727 RepID=A0A8T0TLH4_PANVG|nr:hypothetical protein PVAP13_4KG143705 [Panicum virgatum]
MSYHVASLCRAQDPSYCRGKQEWPELLGKKAMEAKAVILKENTYVDAVVYTPQDAIVTDDYCCNRVRIFVNCHTCDYENAAVVKIPRVG